MLQPSPAQSNPATTPGVVTARQEPPQQIPMETNSFIAHWQEWLTLGGYIGLSLFVAWQVFTRS
jgi:hypothetical protein